MNSLPRLLMVGFSIFVMCSLMAYFYNTKSNATAFDKEVIARGDTLQEAASYDSDFSDYDKQTECIEATCSDVKNCTDSSHRHVIYYTKQIDGSEVIRLVTKYSKTIKGTTLVRTDRTTRIYSVELPFVKNAINNIDYIDPSDTYVAKIIMRKDEPYTMYFYLNGYQLYNKEGLKKVDELLFKPGGHNYSLYHQFTESGSYVIPSGRTFYLYACASGKGTKAGQAISKVKVENCTKVDVELTYEGSTVITVSNSNGGTPVVTDLEGESFPTAITLKAGCYDSSHLFDQELLAAKNLFKAYSTGEDGENGYDGAEYYLTNNEYTLGQETYSGGQGGQGGAFGFGGAGGNGGYRVFVNNTTKFIAYQNAPLGGGAGYATGYSGINYEKLKSLLPVSLGGYVNDSLAPNDIDYAPAASGGNGTLLFGGNGGTAGIISATNFINSFGQFTANAGGGGGGGGYGAGGGAGGNNTDGTIAQSGKPSGGMVYLSFE